MIHDSPSLCQWAICVHDQEFTLNTLCYAGTDRIGPFR